MNAFNSFDAFSDFVDMLVQQRDYTRGLEKKLKRVEKERNDWREMAEPGWRKRELEAAIDGEIRLLREQG